MIQVAPKRTQWFSRTEDSPPERSSVSIPAVVGTQKNGIKILTHDSPIRSLNGKNTSRWYSFGVRVNCRMWSISVRRCNTAKLRSYQRRGLKEMGAFLARCSYVISNDSVRCISLHLSVFRHSVFTDQRIRIYRARYGEKNLWVRDETLDCLECNLTDCPIGNICMSQPVCMKRSINPLNN
jgi:hypothetical protein